MKHKQSQKNWNINKDKSMSATYEEAIFFAHEKEEHLGGQQQC